MSDSGRLSPRPEDPRAEHSNRLSPRGDASDRATASSDHDASADPLDQLLISSGSEGKSDPGQTASDDAADGNAAAGDPPRSETAPDENSPAEAAQDVQSEPEAWQSDTSDPLIPPGDTPQPDGPPGDEPDAETVQTDGQPGDEPDAQQGDEPDAETVQTDVPQQDIAPPDLGAVPDTAGGDVDEGSLLPEGFKVVDGEDLVPRLALTPAAYSEEELDSVLASFMKSRGRIFKDIPAEMRRPLFQHIARKRVEAIGNQDYEYGERLVAAAELLRQLIGQELSASDVAFGAESLESRLQRAKTALREAQLRFAERVKRLDDELRERELEMRERHDAEIRQFQDDWADPKFFHKWNKPSSQLLLVRMTEKNLALTGDFAGAKQMKRHGARLERLETNEAQGRAKEAMEVEFQQLIDRHTKKHEGHERLKHKVMLQAEVVNNTELTPLKMAVKKLEALREQRIVPKRSPPVSKSKVEIKRRPEASLHGDTPPVPTPRTMQRLQSIRQTPRSAALALKAVETSAYIRANKPQDKRKPVRPKKAYDF
jgi:hypothetical protein